MAIADAELEAVAPMTDYVTFRIGEQLCGVEAVGVQQVFRLRGLTPVPLAPPEIAGVMSLRGRIITAVRARTRLGLPPADESIAIGLEHDGDGYGLLVDSVGEVIGLDAATVGSPPGILPERWSDAVTGVSEHGGELLLILDAQKMLAPWTEGES